MSPPIVTGGFAKHEQAPTTEAQRRRLLFGMLAPPLAWFVQLQADYALVPWVCAHGHRFVLVLVSIAAFVVCAAGAWAAWNGWPGGTPWHGEPHGIEGARMLSLLGVMLSFSFAIVVIATVIPTVILRPCD
jgi:hypothetical protein